MAQTEYRTEYHIPFVQHVGQVVKFAEQPMTPPEAKCSNVDAAIAFGVSVLNLRDVLDLGLSNEARTTLLNVIVGRLVLNSVKEA